MPELNIHNGADGWDLKVPFTGKVLTLGSDAKNTLCLQGEGVAGRQVQIYSSGDGWQVRNLAANGAGTTLNDSPLAEDVQLEHGAVLRFGPFTVEFRDPKRVTSPKTFNNGETRVAKVDAHSSTAAAPKVEPKPAPVGESEPEELTFEDDLDAEVAAKSDWMDPVPPAPRAKPASDVARPASGVVKPASGAVKTASGAVKTASGAVKTASGVVQTGSGAVKTASDVVKTASDVHEGVARPGLGEARAEGEKRDNERRNSVRVALSQVVSEMRPAGMLSALGMGASVIPVRLVDLSERGAKVVAMAPVDRKQQYSIKLSHSKLGAIQVTARIMWGEHIEHRTQYGEQMQGMVAGLRFESGGRKQIEIVRGLMEKKAKSKDGMKVKYR